MGKHLWFRENIIPGKLMLQEERGYREVKLSWAHPATLKHTDINFKVTDSVAR